ncbi:MAG: SH3 domain-containing protein [Clostridia bacterium]|nr:SH3 domain-containing protein [Clostridia bacterium]
MSAKKKLKITPQGYLVIAAAAILLIAIIVIICVLSCGGNEGATGQLDGSPSPGTSATLPPVSETTVQPDDSSSPSAETSTSPSAAESTNTPSPTTSPTTIPTASPSNDPDALSAPTAEMRANAVTGKLAKDNVNMRQGPSTNHAIVASSIRKGTALTVYVLQEGWYFVRIDSLDKYGYIRQDMVSLDRALGSAEQVEQPSGTIKGKITASALVLRNTPEIRDDNKNGNYYKDQEVFIFYKEPDSAGNIFYYVQISGTNITGYLCAKEADRSNYMISAEGTVPDKP